MQNEALSVSPGRNDDQLVGYTGVTLSEAASIIAKRWRFVIGGSLCAGLIALGAAFLLPPIYSARTVILPPQQSQSSAASALSSLGALSGLAGGALGVKNPGDQYIALLESATMSNKIIDRFNLMNVYQREFRIDAQRELDGSVRISVGKKDGLIAIEVDDTDPARSAAIANAYVEELRTLTTDLAVTEAQQRRVFFQDQLKSVNVALIQAQLALQSSGISEGTLKADPRAAAEGYAALRAELTAGEIKLQTLRGSLSDEAQEIIQQRAGMAALRRQISKMEESTQPKDNVDYITRYREFKYQEALFEILARQYEMARVDESREGALIQVLDAATVPERKSKPKRGLIAVGATLLAAFLLSSLVVIRYSRGDAASRLSHQ